MNFPRWIFLALGIGLGAALFLPPAASADDDPRPCFVMPHPLKTGGAPHIGGAGRAYSDGHLHGDGVMDAAEAPIRSINMVAIRVDFEDQPMDSTGEYFEHAMTYLRQMYAEMSDGQLELTTTITDRVYRLPRTMAYYGLDDSIATREAALVRDAVQAADDDVDYSGYNAYMLFHAGPGQEADINDDSRDQIWSVFFRQVDLEYWLDAPDAALGVRTNDLNEKGAPFYVTSMVVCPETESQDNYNFGLLGVVAHEFGHRFGLPDLYDTTAPDGFEYAESQGIGAFGLMGAGIWNEDGWFPAEYCAWSKYYVGWLRPTVVRPEDGLEHALSLAAVESAGNRRTAAVRIPMGGDEYLLIENRVRDYNGNGKFDFDDVNDNGKFDFGIDSYAGCEFDWYLPREPENLRLSPELDGSGLLIWHIDESIIRERILYNVVNADALHKGVDLEEADGVQDLDKLRFTFEAFGDPKDAFYAPFATAITPETTPSSLGYNDAASEVWITDISGPGATMTFTLRFGPFDLGGPRELPGLVRDFQPLAANLDDDPGLEMVAVTVNDAGFGGLTVIDDDGSIRSGGAVAPMGTIYAEPVLLEHWMTRGAVAWVSGDSVMVSDLAGLYALPDGTVTPTPTPFFRLDRAPGRVHLTAADLDGNGVEEIFVGESAHNDDVNLTVLARARGEGNYLTRATFQHAAPGPFGVGTLVAGDDAEEIVASVSTEVGGYVAVATLSPAFAGGRLANTWAYSVGDSIRYTAPVVGDLDRDGTDDIVFGDSRGWLHAVRYHEPVAVPLAGAAAITEPNYCDECFDPLPGWPVPIGTLETDEVSLIDTDGDGYLEVLAFGPGNVLHIVNYNATSILALPMQVPGEDRFTQPFLSPLALDLNGDGHDDLCLPLPDGQIRGHDALGRELAGWDYLGGAQQGLYPILADLDHDGMMELATFEDVTRAIPPDLVIEAGDESPGLDRTGRVVIREVGPAAAAPGGWPMYRADGGRSGHAVVAASPGPDPVADRGIDELFVMPNPVRGEDAGFHYRVADGVDRVVIEIHDVTGRLIRTLDGSVFPRTDNIARWDLRNDDGSDAAPGLFFARVRVEGGGSATTRMIRFAVLR